MLDPWCLFPEEKSEEEEPKELPSPKKVPGIPKFGLPGMPGMPPGGGASLLAEMKAKRATMKTGPSAPKVRMS